MQCKNCLAPLSEGDTYCKVCGKPVEEAPQTLPSNEEIIAAYTQEPVEEVPVNPVPTVEPVAPVQAIPTTLEDLAKTVTMAPVEPQPAMDDIAKTVAISPVEPVQTLEQTNVMRPVEAKEPTYIPTPQPVVQPVQPVQIDLNVPLEEVPSRPAPISLPKEKGKVDKKVFFIGIAVAAVAAMFITILICIPITASKVEKAKKNKEESITVPKKIIENRVFFGGYTFLIPEGFAYKIEGQQFVVEKLETKEAMALQIATDTYANMKEHLTSVKTNLTTAKWVVGKIYMDQNIKNRVYLFVEATAPNKKNVMITYTKANDTKVFATVYVDPRKVEYPTETIETFHEVIDSALEVKVSVTTNMASYTQNKVVFPAVK